MRKRSEWAPGADVQVTVHACTSSEGAPRPLRALWTCTFMTIQPQVPGKRLEEGTPVLVCTKVPLGLPAVWKVLKGLLCHTRQRLWIVS